MPDMEESDISLTGPLTRSDERYLSQCFGVINKTLDQILNQQEKFEKKIDDYALRTDRRITKNEDNVSAGEVRITRLETYFKIGGMLGGFACTILSGILINNWGNITAPPSSSPHSYTK
jgi:hypothetical protein